MYDAKSTAAEREESRAAQRELAPGKRTRVPDAPAESSSSTPWSLLALPFEVASQLPSGHVDVVIDLQQAFDVLAWVHALDLRTRLDTLGVKVEQGAIPVRLRLDALTQTFAIDVPVLRVTALHTHGLTSGPGTLLGLNVHGDLGHVDATFAIATLSRPNLGGDLEAREVELIGGSFATTLAAVSSATIHIASATLRGAVYNGSPPTDITVSDAAGTAVIDLRDLAIQEAWSHQMSKLAAPVAAAPPPARPLPKIWLDGMRVVSHLDGVRAKATLDGTSLGFQHFDAALVDDRRSSAEPPSAQSEAGIASISIDGFEATESSGRRTGKITRLATAGTPDSIRRLRESEGARDPNVSAALQIIDELGLVGPTTVTDLVFENAGSHVDARADVAAELALPDLGARLRITAKAARLHVADPAASADFGQLLLALSDATTHEVIAELEVRGEAHIGAKTTRGELHVVGHHGDLRRLATAVHGAKLPPALASAVAALSGHGILVDAEVSKQADKLDGHVRIASSALGAIDVRVKGLRRKASHLDFDHFEAKAVTRRRKGSPETTVGIVVGDGHGDLDDRQLRAASVDITADASRLDLEDAINRMLAISVTAAMPAPIREAILLVQAFTRAGPAKPVHARAARTHLACKVPNGTLDVTLVHAAGGDGAASFKTLDLDYTDETGASAAHLHATGGDAHGDDATLAEAHGSGRLGELAKILDTIRGTLPARVIEAVDLVRAHGKLGASAFEVGASDVHATPAGVSAKTASARVAFPGGEAVATVANGRREGGEASADRVELAIAGGAAAVTLTRPQLRGDLVTYDAVEVTGNGAKLLDALQPYVLDRLPAEIGGTIRAFSSTIIHAVGSCGVASLQGVDMDDITLTGAVDIAGADDTRYRLDDAKLTAVKPHVTLGDDHLPREVRAKTIRITGTAEAGSMSGAVLVTAGEGTLIREHGRTRLEATSIHAELDGTYATAGTSEHRLTSNDELAEIAAATRVRKLALDVAMPIHEGSYGMWTVAPHTSASFHLEIERDRVVAVGVQYVPEIRTVGGAIGLETLEIGPSKGRLLLDLADRFGWTDAQPLAQKLVAILRENVSASVFSDQDWAGPRSTPPLADRAVSAATSFAAGVLWQAIDLTQITADASADVSTPQLPDVKLAVHGSGGVSGNNVDAKAKAAIDVKSLSLEGLDWHQLIPHR